MILLHENLTNNIEFEENRVNFLVIENKNFYITFLEDLIKSQSSEDNPFSLFKGLDKLKISDKIEIIDNIFSINVNSKKIINKVYKDLQELSIKAENYLETKNFEASILKYLYFLISKYDHFLEINDNFDFKDLLKIFSLKIVSNFSNKIEEIVEYIDLCNEILKKEIFVLINFHTFFTKQELSELYKHCFYKKIHLIVAENQKSDIILEEEKLFIIDNDLCEIKLT